jgi:hypothetical protein
MTKRKREVEPEFRRERPGFAERAAAAERLRRLLELARQIECEYCGARIGEDCKTLAGQPALDPHRLRRHRAYGMLKAVR